VTTPTGAEWPIARALAEQLVADTGDTVAAILLYGSRLHQTNPDAHSAVDFVVVVDEYRPFYEALASASQLHRPVGLVSALARFLAPNVIAYAPGDGRQGLGKCLVVSRAHLARALGPTPPDHFLLGRLVQKVGGVWAADEESAAWVQSQVDGARARVLDWMAPYLEGSFDGAELGQRLLEVCYAGEIRPESKGRAGLLFEAQIAHFQRVFAPVLEACVQDGVLERDGARYRLSTPVTASERRRWQRHFRRSKRRTTMRWFKHALTFANWLPYIVRKVERHTGRTIELTFLERKVPVLFIWPRVFHVLFTRPPREIER